MMLARSVVAAAALAAAVLLPAVPGSSAAASPATDPPSCAGENATIVGPGNGTLVGTSGDDVIVTNGAALVEAGDGTDHICVTGPPVSSVTVDGGPGNDDISVAGAPSTGVTVVGGPGDDDVSLDEFWAAPLTLEAGPGADTLDVDYLAARRTTIDVRRELMVDDAGTVPPVTLTGFESYLVFAQGDGNRRVTFDGSAASEYFDSDACFVRAFGHRGRDDLGVEPLSEGRCSTLHGHLYGGRGRDVLRGARGAAHGPDRLIGGRGFDRANGGRGRDVCRAEVRVSCERR